MEKAVQDRLDGLDVDKSPTVSFKGQLRTSSRQKTLVSLADKLQGKQGGLQQERQVDNPRPDGKQGIEEIVVTQVLGAWCDGGAASLYVLHMVYMCRPWRGVERCPVDQLKVE